jgi:arabinofuranosyltransferase
MDPVTLPVIGLSVALGLVVRQSYAATPVCAGIFAYLVYVVSIGGDFMSGRFFAVPLFVAACTLSRLPASGAAAFVPGLAAIVYLGLVVRADFVTGMNPALRSTSLQPSGIEDERAFYWPGYALFYRELPPLRRSAWAARLGEQREVVSGCSTLGALGLVRGPALHAIDLCGLTDPLVARIAAPPGERIGHFGRAMPVGYEESVGRGENLLENPCLRRMYDAILLVTQGEIFSAARLRAIAELGSGRFRECGRVHMLFDRKQEGAAWDVGTILFAKSTSLNVEGFVTNPRMIDISLDNNDTFQVDFELGDEVVASMTLGPKEVGGLARYIEPLPAQAIARGFDHVTVRALAGDGIASVGHILFESAADSTAAK